MISFISWTETHHGLLSSVALPVILVCTSTYALISQFLHESDMTWHNIFNFESIYTIFPKPPWVSQQETHVGRVKGICQRHLQHEDDPKDEDLLQPDPQMWKRRPVLKKRWCTGPKMVHILHILVYNRVFTMGNVLRIANWQWNISPSTDVCLAGMILDWGFHQKESQNQPEILCDTPRNRFGFPGMIIWGWGPQPWRSEMKVVISEEGFKPQKDRHASIMFNYVQSITISVGIYFSAFFSGYEGWTWADRFQPQLDTISTNFAAYLDARWCCNDCLRGLQMSTDVYSAPISFEDFTHKNTKSIQIIQIQDHWCSAALQAHRSM